MGRPSPLREELESGGRFDPVAVRFVCEGTPMPLRGSDRAEAIRQLAARGLHAAAIAARVVTDLQLVVRIGRELKIEFPKPQGAAWWELYVDPRARD